MAKGRIGKRLAFNNLVEQRRGALRKMVAMPGYEVSLSPTLAKTRRAPRPQSALPAAYAIATIDSLENTHCRFSVIHHKRTTDTSSGRRLQHKGSCCPTSFPRLVPACGHHLGSILKVRRTTIQTVYAIHVAPLL